MNKEVEIEVRGMDLGYDSAIVLRDINFQVNRGDIFIIMGRSGSGKSTVLKTLIGLNEPIRGQVKYRNVSFWDLDAVERDVVMRRFGILYQSGALWSSLTLAENVALPLQMYTPLTPSEIGKMVSLKLELVGLAGFEEYYPSEISGGMKKRAALARAMALDPEILFFDEPSSGLDPVSARLLDRLILDIRDSLGTTIVMVTHDLKTILAIGTNSIFVDAESRTVTANGNPKELLRDSHDPKIKEFLTQ